MTLNRPRFKECAEYSTIRSLSFLNARLASPVRPAPKRILAVESFGVGDVVCALPAVRALKAAHPAAEMVFVTSRTALQFCKGLPFIDRCEVCPRSGRELWRFLGRWRSWRRDTLAVLLNDGWWQNLGIHLLDPRWACGYLYRPRLDTRYHPERLVTATWDRAYRETVAPETHLVRRSLMAALPVLSMTMPDSVPLLPELAALPQSKLPDALEKMLSAETPFVVLHPGTRGKDKRWPAGHWHELIELLSVSCRLLIAGGPSEADFCKDLLPHENDGQVRCLAGELSLAQEATLMSRAACFVGPDCGPAHLASAVGCPVVMLMGPTAPETSGPFWNRSRVVRAADGAGGAERKTGDVSSSMDSITVSEVFSAIAGIFPI